MHKFIIGTLFLLITCLSFSQDSLEAYSYYFKNNECKPYELGTYINLTNWGAYALINSKTNQLRITAGDDLVIDETGLYIAKNKLLSISREEIRENSKYIVKNGYLHGISNTDSFAVALQDELYYFLMPSKAFLFKQQNENQKLYQIKTASYLVLTKEDNGYYSALKFTITNSKITLAELDLTYYQVEEMTHKLTTENNIKTYLMDPNKKEWDIILKSFVIYDRYLLK
jgi:hypothetical protein